MNIKLYPPQAIYELGHRSNQEDSIFPLLGNATTDDRLFVLCDGMGGHERGEVASSAICQGLADFFQKEINADEILPDEKFLDALEYAYQQLDAKDNGSFRKTGTTMTMLYFHRGGCTAAHIGDSRIYHVRPSSRTILYKSRDHSLVFELYQMGEIGYDEMKTHPRKNQISRAMIPGADNRQEADIVHITDIQPDDYFLICSDGVLESMDDKEILDWLEADANDEEKCKELVKATNGNDDNHSAYLVHVKDVIAEPNDENLLNDEQSVRFNAINIHPVMQERNDDDVKIVVPAQPVIPSASKRSASSKALSKKRTLNFWWPFIALLLLFAIVIFGYSHFKGSSKNNSRKAQVVDTSSVRPELPANVTKPQNRTNIKNVDAEPLNARSVVSPKTNKAKDSIHRTNSKVDASEPKNVQKKDVEKEHTPSTPTEPAEVPEQDTKDGESNNNYQTI